LCLHFNKGYQSLFTTQNAPVFETNITKSRRMVTTLFFALLPANFVYGRVSMSWAVSTVPTGQSVSDNVSDQAYGRFRLRKPLITSHACRNG